MRIWRWIPVAGLASALWAQGTDATALAWRNARVNIQSATVSLRTLRNTSKASETVKSQVDKLLEEGAGFLAKGNTGEVRRRIFHALTLLGGEAWNPREEYAASLLLRTDVRVADSGRRLVASLAQVYPAEYQPRTGLRLRVSLHEETPARTGPQPAKLLREVGTLEAVGRDLIDEPFAFSVSLAGIGEGPRVLTAELLDGEESIRKVWTGIMVTSGLEAKRVEMEKRLDSIAGHESAKATVRAPFDLMDMTNLDRREYGRVDFASEVRRSGEVLAALEAGSDPVVGAPGNNKRHYYFAEAGEIMPYRVYVPSSYKPGAHLPLVVALHGLGGNEDTFLGRGGGMMQKLAEQHGFLVVAPLGYRINGGYGSSIRRFADAARKRSAELSEKDVMNVLKLVSEEYGTDPARTYLMGHSMGGGGTWYLGSKYAEKWAAMAPIAGPGSGEGYPFERLKGMPVMVCHGDADATVPVAASRMMVAGMKSHGLAPVYIEVAGASHGSVVETVMPGIFDFFDKQRR